MVDQEILKELKKYFDEGASEAKIEYFPSVLEYFKQVAQESDAVKEELEGQSWKCGSEAFRYEGRRGLCNGMAIEAPVREIMFLK